MCLVSHCFAASPFFSVSSPVKCTTKNYSSGKALQVQSIILATCHEGFVQVEPNYSVGMSKAKFCQVYSFKWVVHRFGDLQGTVCTCTDCYHQLLLYFKNSSSKYLSFPIFKCEAENISVRYIQGLVRNYKNCVLFLPNMPTGCFRN